MQKTNEARKQETPNNDAEKIAIEDLLADVALDAQKRPEAYLAETIVPEGGE